MSPSAPTLALDQPLDVREMMPAVPGIGAHYDRQRGSARLGVHELALQFRPAQAAQ